MAISTLPSRQTNRLTPADIASVRGSIAVTMRSYPQGYRPSIGADFNHLQRGAYAVIRARLFALTECEVDEIADIVLGSILSFGESR